MGDFETIQEIVLAAYRKMTSDIWDHVTGGSESETTLRRNRQSLDSLAFRPRVLRDVTGIDSSTTFLGRHFALPVFLAPVGSLEDIYPEGGLACLRAAAAFGIPMFLSSVVKMQLETAAATTEKNLVFQLYVQGDADWVDRNLERVEKSGCTAFCLTVDTAIYSRRERNLFNRYAPSGRRRGPREGFNYQATMTWDLVDKIRNRFDIPVIVKGIATAEDARLAVEHGVQVIYVSNHGGRQLDHGRASIDVLPGVVEAVDGRADVLVDGGFVRGSDILKAIALGARAVGIGKLQAWALAAGGEATLTGMLEILEKEIAVNMALLGVTRLDQLDSSYLHPATPVTFPDAFSPFPSLAMLLGS
ncbi:MAG: alpha-hydroxy acid oxidase [Desulfobacterales bacterium]|nr:alpha-hydroxy acid oxidase [Desulfobacterales bacterium]